MVNNVSLPTRDFLQQLIAQSYVKESELKEEFLFLVKIKNYLQISS